MPPFLLQCLSMSINAMHLSQFIAILILHSFASTVKQAPKRMSTQALYFVCSFFNQNHINNVKKTQHLCYVQLLPSLHVVSVSNIIQLHEDLQPLYNSCQTESHLHSPWSCKDLAISIITINIINFHFKGFQRYPFPEKSNLKLLNPLCPREDARFAMSLQSCQTPKHEKIIQSFKFLENEFYIHSIEWNSHPL